MRGKAIACARQAYDNVAAESRVTQRPTRPCEAEQLGAFALALALPVLAGRDLIDGNVDPLARPRVFKLHPTVRVAHWRDAAPVEGTVAKRHAVADMKSRH